MKGGCGLCVRGVDAIETILTSAPRSAPATAVAAGSLSTCTDAFSSSCPDASKFFPVASEEPLIDSSVASKVALLARSVAVTSNQVAEVKAIRSRSRSQTSRMATDCTRPAERALSTARQSTGETS